MSAEHSLSGGGLVELGGILHKLDAVRRRSTLILLARGLAWNVWAWLVTLLAFGTLLMLIPAPRPIRIVFVLAQIALAGWLVWKKIVMPWRERRNRRVWAMYCEENLPNLNKRLVTCVDLAEDAGDAGPFASNPVAAMLLRDTAKAFGRFNLDTTLPAAHIRNALLLAVTPVFLFAGSAMVAPTFVSSMLASLYTVDRDAVSAPGFHRPQIDVAPGNTEVPRGGQLTIRATVTYPFESKPENAPVATLHFPNSPPVDESLAAVEGDASAFELTVHDVQQDFSYDVALEFTQTRRYTVVVYDPPAIDGIVSTVTPPVYTRAEPRVTEGTFVEALHGSQVRIEIKTTATLKTARLEAESGETIEGSLADEAAVFTLDVAKSVDYKVEIIDSTGHANVEPPTLSITMIEDKKPEISVKQPGADWDIHPIGEIKLRAEVKDDFGLGALSFEYQINGGATQRVPLYSVPQSGAASVEATGEYTLYLEDLKANVGDVILYQFRANDLRPDQEKAESTSQPYFVTVRPYEQRFMTGGTGGQGEGITPPNQREVIVATSRLIEMLQDIDKTDAASKSTDLSQMQSTVRSQTVQFLRNMRGRSDLPDRAERVAHIEQAIEDMSTARNHLEAAKPQEALSPENSALAHLLAAAAGLPKSNGQGGGGGGAPPPSLLGQKLESERDKFEARNGLAPEVDKALMDAIERAKALAQRQKEFAETIKREQPPEGGNSGQGSGAPSSQSSPQNSNSNSQNSPLRSMVNREEMLQRIEEAKREIERLQDELLELEKVAPEITPDLEQALRNAARDMSRLANAVENEQWDQAEGANARAFDQLQELQLALERARDQSLGSPLQNLLEQVQAMQEEQERMQAQMPTLAQAQPGTRSALTEQQRALAGQARQAAQTAQAPQSSGAPMPGAAAPGLQSAAQAMESAAARMGSRQVERASESQRAALAELERVAALLQEQIKNQTPDHSGDIQQALDQLQALKASLEATLANAAPKDGGEIQETSGGSPTDGPGGPSAQGGNTQSGGGNGGGLSRVGGAPRDQRGGDYSNTGGPVAPTRLFDASAMQVQLKTIEHLLEPADIATPLVDSLIAIAANDMWAAPDFQAGGDTEFTGEFLSLLGQLEDILAEELAEKDQLQRLQQTPAEELSPRYGEWARRYFEALGAQRAAALEQRTP